MAVEYERYDLLTPGTLPLTLDEVRDYLKVDDKAEDELLNALLLSAVEHA